MLPLKIRIIQGAAMCLITLCFKAHAAENLYDRNSNGVSDVWEARYGLFGPSSDTDTDGDGVNDLVEASQGTDPWNPKSLFRLEVISHRKNAQFLRWDSKVGKRYQVQGQDKDNTWIDLGEPVNGNGNLAGFGNSSSSATSFAYRVAIIDDLELRPEIQAEMETNDADSDGQNDWIEWRAGTSLIDPSELFQLKGIESADVVTFQWSTVRGMTYRLQQLANSTWVDLEGSYSGDGETCHATIPSSGPSGIFRLVSESKDSDGDSLRDWEEYLAGLDPYHPNTVDVERTDDEVLTQEMLQGGVFTLETVKTVLIAGKDQEGSVRVRRTGGLAAVTVPLSIGGSAVAGVDYESLPSSLNIGFGVKEMEIPVHLIATGAPESSKNLTISLGSSPSYQLGTAISRTVTLLAENLIDVKSYGALGNGVADDSAAIQSAINALETSSVHNGLFFPAGTYRLATKMGDSSAPTGSYRILRLGRTTDLAGRDLVLKGEPGAVLYSDVSPYRVNMLLCIASFRSLSILNLRFEKESAPLTPIPGGEPNGSDGVTVVNKDGREVESIRFEDTEFFNCHRSVSIYGAGYDLRGKCGAVIFDTCKVLNPYGSNTINGATAWGGGQQIYIAPWVAEARYQSCLFDGGSDDMTDSYTTPGGVMKDGCHFGSPLRLWFHHNIVKRMGVEAVAVPNDSNLLGYTQSSFEMPPADNVTEVEVTVSTHPSTWVVGETVTIRTPGTPGVSSSSNLMTIRGFDPTTRLVTLSNPGTSGNVPQGTVFPSGRIVYLDQRPNPTLALIEDNLLDGTIPPGGVAFNEQAGILFNARCHITKNLIRNFGYGILVNEEVRTPRHPTAKGSVIDHNVILTRNAAAYPAVYTYGINVWGSNERIRENIVRCPISTKTVGIVVLGKNSWVEANSVIADQILVNGYTSSTRSVGVASSNTAGGLFATGNFTRGFDVGVGPSGAFQAIPYRVANHHSVQDILPIDPTGLQSN